MWFYTFRFEWLEKARLPQTWLIIIALFIAGLLTMAGSAEAFDPHSKVGADSLKADAPLQLWRLFQFFRWPMLLLLPLLVAESLHKDVSSNMYLLLYAYPLQKRAYLGAKLANGLLWAGSALLALTAGIVLGRYWPGVNTELLFPFRGLSHVWAMLSLGSTVFWVSVLLFALVLHFRSIYPAYAALIVIWLLAQLSNQLLGGFGWESVAAFVDPTNEASVELATRYWLRGAINTQPLPVTRVVFANHALYWMLSLSILAFAAYRFRFELPIQKEKGAAILQAVPPTPLEGPFPHSLNKPQPISLLAFLIREQLRYILSGRLFYLLLALGGALLLFQQHNQNPTYGFDLLPTTWHLLRRPALVYSGLVILLTFFYTGRLLHRSRLAGMDALEGVCPHSNGMMLGAAFGGISLMQLLLLLLFIACGLAVQYAEGYAHFQLGLYGFELVLLYSFSLVLWTVLSLFVYTLLGHWQYGLLLLLLTAAGVSALSDLGISSYLLRLFQAPAYTYSDWNGYNGTLAPYLAYKGYWLAFAGVLLVLTELCWQREAYHSWGERLQIIARRFRGKRILFLSASILLWLAVGTWLYQTEQAAHRSQPLDEMQWRAAIEKRFWHFQRKPSPKITAAKLTVNITPRQGTWSAKAQYTLKNTSPSPIDTLLIYNHPLLQSEMHWADSVKALAFDSLPGISLWVLGQPLLPDSSLVFDCHLRQAPTHWLLARRLVGKHTCVLSDSWFPSVGFPLNLRIQSPILRKQYQLPALDSLPSTAHSYSGADADRIRFEAAVKVPSGYTALAPGQLAQTKDSLDWITYHYRTAVPVKHNFAIYLAPYAEQVRRFGPHTISTYIHPDHDHHTEVLIEGMEAALAFAENNYGPAQHRDLRIIEFPLGEGTYATLMGNQLLFSEAYLLFDRKEAAIDLPFYVAAHEMSHHWWGNQLLPAAGPGAKMLTESLSEYTALQVLRQAKGEAAYRQMLDYNLDLYLRGRQDDEPPLYKARTSQQYLHYRKGALAFCALADCWDTDALNEVLRCFFEDYRLKGPPYPKADELLMRLKAAAPDHLQQLISDYFEQTDLKDYQKQLRCSQEVR
jgi:ABC-2 type transport system permease protein